MVVKKLIALLSFSMLLSSAISKEPSSLSLVRMNVFFQGFDNPIILSHPKYSCERLLVKLEPESLAVLNQTGCGEYQIQLQNRNPHGINVLVFKDNFKPKNLLSSQNFRTLRMPSPVASLNGNIGNTITVAQLAEVTEVQIDIPGFVYGKIQYKVSSFNYIYKAKKGNIIVGTATTSSIPIELKDAFLHAEKDDLLIISNVFAHSIYLGETPISGSLVFKVLEK